ncbi:MAG: hypothetical protein AUF79_12470 [Crenarchaeota archaeon 13_1_20CM_2_51_8]|nr:MAG: hypothetical protein AUF79_12470 [Crenarchaeota archaeon 13_1_20CM_2_51_8]
MQPTRHSPQETRTSTGLAIWVSDLLYHEVANALGYKPEFDKNKLAIAVQDLFGYHPQHSTD